MIPPDGPQAGHLHDLWIVMLATCTVVFVAVMVALAIAVRRGRRRAPDGTMLGDDRRAERRIAIAVAVSAAGLIALFVASLRTDRALAELPLAGALHVEITGHQWWWEVRYDDADPSRVFTTANELHLPVGRPVVLTLKASDVIHSFWVPSLAGKKDLIPGRTALLSLRADRAGTFGGPCAEFCGWQHAKMLLTVVAEPPDAYERWAERQRMPAPEPADALAARGRTIVESTTCAMCHAVAGTRAQGRHAPDLTHVASRATLGAGALTNTPAHRAAWIADAPRAKPGTQMPPQPLPPEDLRAVLAYVETLE